MCGRYTLTLEGSMVAGWFDVVEGEIDLVPRYNIAPSQDVLTITNNGEANHTNFMRWGLIPFWAKDTKIGYKMINARAETIMEKNSFKNAFKKRRCLVPADSFYEWRKDGKSKTPMRIMLKSEEPFAFAGLWESWKYKIEPDAPPIHSCTIITTVPNSFMEPIHNRMPVILPREYYSAWVDPESEDTGGLMEMLTPYDSTEMKAYEVSTLVNSPKNQGEELVLPIG